MTKKAILKLVRAILDNPKDVDFATIKKLLELFGYECRQPKGGSSHFVFRKAGTNPITVPKNKPVKTVYVKEIIKLLGLEAWYEENN